MNKTMKRKLLEMIAIKSEAREARLKLVDTSEQIEELRALQKEIDTLNEEIRNLEELCESIEDEGDGQAERTLAVTGQLPGIVLANASQSENRDESRGEEAEYRAFANYIRRECGVPYEVREGEQNLDMTNAGAIIPSSIARRIITRVAELSPIFDGATTFRVPGKIKVPVWGKANTTHGIAVGYQSEFTEITADSGKFTTVDLEGHLSGALTLIGRSIINNVGVDVVDFIIEQMAREIAIFMDAELLVGTPTKATGAIATTSTVVAGSTSKISADKLIELQAKVPRVFQREACWTMHPDTFTAVRKLKDGEGRYLLQPNFAGGAEFILLGKPVEVSENMPEISSAAKAILYGNYSGLGMNMSEDISIEVLTEKYATMHALGVVAWFEFDSDVIDHQQLATLVMSDA